MISRLLSISAAALLAATLAAAREPSPPPTGGIDAEYLHSFSTNFGKLPLSGVGLSYDPLHREVYVTGDGPVRVFNDSGMEVYTFRESPELAAALGVAAMEDGDLVALVRRLNGYALLRCTFRGEVISEIVPRNVPEPYASITPGIMRYASGKIYLADDAAMRILVLDQAGQYVASYDVAEKIEMADQRAELGMRGFGVDGEGNLLFTIQPLFKAYVMTPAGAVQGFGVRGSAPGRFNIVGGITRDAAGNYYVADMLKSAILVFDRNFRFVKEFGYRGPTEGSLAVPEEIVVGGDKLFVSNRGRKGVSVFHVAAR